MLSTAPMRADVSAAWAACASGHVLKTATAAAQAGEVDLADEARQAVAATPDQPTFSPRQRVVLDVVTAGLSNKAIARDLGFAAEGAKALLKMTYRKLGAQQRAEAVVAAVHQGFLRL